MIFKDIQYCQKFKEIGGHHEEKMELKQLIFLRVYLSDKLEKKCSSKNLILTSKIAPFHV